MKSQVRYHAISKTLDDAMKSCNFNNDYVWETKEPCKLSYPNFARYANGKYTVVVNKVKNKWHICVKRFVAGFIIIRTVDKIECIEDFKQKYPELFEKDGVYQKVTSRVTD